MAQNESVVGTWTLTRWGRLSADNMFVDYGPEVRGRLIYSGNGLMSAHLERVSTKRPDQKLILGYSGRWHIDGQAVHHAVDFSNIPEFLGTTLTRTIILINDGHLHLETPLMESRMESQNGMTRDLLEWERDLTVVKQ